MTSDDLHRLRQQAEGLNRATEELNAPIKSFDVLLAKLNLGVECWVNVPGHATLRFGYARLGEPRKKQWGLAIRETHPEHSGEWLFSRAPRNLRVIAIGALPELFTHFPKAVEALTQRLQTAAAVAKEMAEAVQAAAAVEVK